MRITLIKEQNRKEYIKEMEDTYKPIPELKKILKTTNICSCVLTLKIGNTI